MKLFWKKLNDRAVLPTKRAEDAGFDLYSTEDYVLLMPGEKHLFATGLAVAPSEPGWWLFVVDRGSTGSRGLHTHCGIVDNGYRGELFVCINNDNPYPVIFSRAVDKIYKDDQACLDNPLYTGPVLYYPLSKAIAQIIVMPQPSVESFEADGNTWAELSNTERGTGALGASGK